MASIKHGAGGPRSVSTDKQTVFLVMLAVVGILLTQGVSLAAPPELMRYQARLTDEAGVPLAGSHDLSFALQRCRIAGPKTIIIGIAPQQAYDGEITNIRWRERK